MQLFLARWIQRFFVLVIGIVAVYIALWQVFPVFDRRLPIAVAIFATYVVMAYAVLPLGTRLFHLITRPTHIPLYCLTPDGLPSDPINIGLIGNRNEIIRAMSGAGWFLADKRTPKTMIKQVAATLFGQTYNNAPFSPLYLFGRKQDLGFEVTLTEKRAHRHHVRFWACNLQAPEEFQADVRFWRRFHRPERQQPTRQLWVGAASKDIGIAPIRHNAQITHRVAPDTNIERERIANDLEATGTVLNRRSFVIRRPYVLQNRALWSLLQCDGKLTICELRPKDI